jgi:hypothetical protein
LFGNWDYNCRRLICLKIRRNDLFWCLEVFSITAGGVDVSIAAGGVDVSIAAGVYVCIAAGVDNVISSYSTVTVSGVTVSGVTVGVDLIFLLVEVGVNCRILDGSVIFSLTLDFLFDRGLASYV